MNYKNTDIEKLESLIADNPVSKIRLTINGLPVCSWNPAKQNKEEHFRSKIKPFLLSSETAGGQYYLEGKNAGYASKQSIFTLAKIDKPGTQMDFFVFSSNSIWVPGLSILANVKIDCLLPYPAFFPSK